jgi:hypothetical protein
VPRQSADSSRYSATTSSTDTPGCTEAICLAIICVFVVKLIKKTCAPPPCWAPRGPASPPVQIIRKQLDYWTFLLGQKFSKKERAK